jgi:hypothetical protein
VRDDIVAGAFLGMAAVAGFVVAVRRGRRDLAAAAIGAFAVIAIAGGSLTLQRTIASTQSVKPFVEGVLAQTQAGAHWAFYRDVSYPVAFYARRSVPSFEAVEALPADRPAVVFAFAERAEELRATSAAAGRVATEQDRFTFGDNPERDPLIAFSLAPPVGSLPGGG